MALVIDKWAIERCRAVISSQAPQSGSDSAPSFVGSDGKFSLSWLRESLPLCTPNAAQAEHILCAGEDGSWKGDALCLGADGEELLLMGAVYYPWKIRGQ